MQRDSLLLLCFFLFVTRHVKSDEGSGDCRNKKDVTIKKGEELKLISSIEPLKRCYFVFTDNYSSNQCCYNRKGSDEDCETSNKYKPGNSTQCPEYDLIVDSLDTETCTLIIKNVGEAVAGDYKIFDQEDMPLRECIVIVIAGGGTGTIIGFIAALLLFVLGLGFLAWRRKRNTETTTSDVEIQNLLLPQNMKEALKKALKEGIIKKTESSDTGEVKVMLLDGSWKEVRTPADVEALSTIV